MTWLDFLALTLAASGVVDVWNNGSIFADWRAFFQDKADEPDEPTPVDEAELSDDEDDGEPLPFVMRIVDRVVPRFIAELVSCSFCFSHHTPWVLAIVCFFPTLFIDIEWITWLLKLPVYSLAATRLGNLITAWAPQEAKYHHD